MLAEQVRDTLCSTRAIRNRGVITIATKTIHLDSSFCLTEIIDVQHCEENFVAWGLSLVEEVVLDYEDAIELLEEVTEPEDRVPPGEL